VAGVHKYSVKAVGATKFCRVTCNIYYPPGAQNSEVAPKFGGNLVYPSQTVKYIHHIVCRVLGLLTYCGLTRSL